VRYGAAVTDATTPSVSASGTRTAIPLRRLLEVVGSMLLIGVLDLLAGAQIEFGSVFTPGVTDFLEQTEVIGSIVFPVIAIAAVVAGLRYGEHAVLRVFVVFLVFATLQVVANIFALIASSQFRDNSYLWGVWDVGAAYSMIVAVFTGWYWAADHLIAAGAFEFPETKGRPHRPPDIIDYLFIAFNTNATFGPTTEAVVSRRVKALMMLQTVCSLLVLMVLVARVVGMRN
jgi:hypothetical protein